MPVSHEKSSFFIHIQKTGGSSIEKALGMEKYPELYGLVDKNETHLTLSDINKLTPYQIGKKNIICLQHLDAASIKKRYPSKIWETYFKFTFVRNPWDREVSSYHYILQRRGDILKRNNLTTKISFLDYLKKNPMRKEINYAHCQIDHITDSQGNLLVDFIGKFENFQNDMNFIFAKLGIQKQVLPIINRSHHKHYTEYYTEEAKQLIAERFKKDIEYFGYKFGK